MHIHDSYDWHSERNGFYGKFGIRNNKDGRLICTYKYSEIQPFQYGIAVIKYKKNIFTKFQFGIINENLEEILFPEYYLDVKILNHKLLAVKVEVKSGVYKWGLIHKNGLTISNPKYDECPEEFVNGFSRVKVEGYYAFINEEGYQICKAQYDMAFLFIKAGFAKVWRNGLEYQMNKKGLEFSKGKVRNYCNQIKKA